MSFTVAVSSKLRKQEIGTVFCYDYRDATSSAGMRAAQTPFRPNPFSAILLILDRKISSKVPK